MTAQTEMTKPSALEVAETHDLSAYFAKPEALEDILTRIETEVRSYAPDLSTAKGRKEIASLAAKVAKSKTALDNAGKALNEDHRKAINAVDAERRKLRDRLDALKQEARAPLTKWEEEEEARVASLTARLAALDAGRADVNCSAEQIAGVLEEIEQTEIGDDWQEYQEEARIARERAIKELTASLETAKQREADQEELARLRAADQQRQEREAAEAAAKAEREQAEKDRRARVVKAEGYLSEISEGRIGGQPQPFAILIYELETKLPPLIDELGEDAATLHRIRIETLSALKKEAEAQRQRDEEEAREKAAAEAKAVEERAAEAERERIQAAQRAEDEARAQREADESHRENIRSEIVEALSAMRGQATPEAIADALMDGKIPHTEVKL